MEIKREVKFEITLSEHEAALLLNSLVWLHDEGDMDLDLRPLLEGLRGSV